MSLLGWDKLSSNDLVRDANFEISNLIKTPPQPHSTTGLYAPDYCGDHPMKEMKLDVTIPWEYHHMSALGVYIRE